MKVHEVVAWTSNDSRTGAPPVGHPGMCELAEWIKMMATQPQPMAGQKILEQQMIYNPVPVELK